MPSRVGAAITNTVSAREADKVSRRTADRDGVTIMDSANLADSGSRIMAMAALDTGITIMGLDRRVGSVLARMAGRDGAVIIMGSANLADNGLRIMAVTASDIATIITDLGRMAENASARTAVKDGDIIAGSVVKVDKALPRMVDVSASRVRENIITIPHSARMVDRALPSVVLNLVRREIRDVGRKDLTA